MGFASLIINTLLITAVVVIHYEILRLLSTWPASFMFMEMT